ncbi:MAG TPA: septum formation initiator family protein [Bacteroidales bacterium]|nr:septum formation initiator family protein [Bacteroidales bacterium]
MQLRLPGFLKNKYFIASVIALVWLAFFENNNLIHQIQMRRELMELRREKAYFLEEIARDSIAVHELKHNPEALERLAREKYLMKKENEVIYIIQEE